MSYTDKHGDFFGRRTSCGNVAICHIEDGLPATYLDADVYPVGSQLTALYEHPEGIVLDLEDALMLGIELE